MNYSIKKVFYFLLPFILLYIILSSVLLNCKVANNSMESNIKEDSFIIANRLAYIKSEPARGDVVVIEHDGEYIVRRIIGVPGDVITFDTESMTVKLLGYAISEDYIDGGTTGGMYDEYVVPEGCYFVMGDNRTEAVDSRHWEEPYVTKDAIIGKALIVYGMWYIDVLPEYSVELMEF